MLITGAQAMVKALEAEGVRIIYGYPGAAICPFIDAIEDSSITYMLVRHEQSAGHAANGCARITGRPGVCFATSGPGATNLITALATAYMDSIPVIAITGQVRSDLIGRDVFQEADITGATEPFTKHSFLLKNAKDLPRVLKEAFFIASSGRPGPVLIDVPVDVQQSMIEFEYPKSVDIRGYKPNFKGHALQINRVAESVSKAKKPVICAGGGIFAAGACKELTAFAKKCFIPVVTTMMGIGALPTDHPLNFGMLGSFGVAAANRAIHEADLLIIVGGRVGDRAVAAPGQIAARTKVVHIDIDPAEIGKNMEAEIPIVGDAKQILHELAEISTPCDSSEWVDYLKNIKSSYHKPVELRPGFIEPRAFIDDLSARMKDNAVLVSDVGQSQIWCANHYKVCSGRFLTSGGMGTMGYSIPAAVGVATANPTLEVVAVCGDGAFQMSMMELATIMHYGVKLKIIIMRNDSLGMVREIQKSMYHCRYVATTLKGSPDFIALAAAYGIAGAKINDNSQALEAIDKMLSHDGPYLLECAISPDEASM
jgi:acetolactate synthase-1/2/3 large subunit